MLRQWDRAGASAVLVEEEEGEEPGAASPAQAAAEKSEQERQREVALALRQAEAAMHSAENRLEDIPNLPSAQLKREVHACIGPETRSAGPFMSCCQCTRSEGLSVLAGSGVSLSVHRMTASQCGLVMKACCALGVQLPAWLRSALGALRTAVLLGAAVLCHMHGPALQVGSAIFVGAALGLSGYRKGSLSASGAPFLSLCSMLGYTNPLCTFSAAQQLLLKMLCGANQGLPWALVPCL